MLVHKLIFILLLIALSGCRDEYRQTAFMKLSNPPVPSGAWLATHATYDYLALSYGVWDNLQMKTAQKQLRQINPQIKLGTYYSTHALGQWYLTAPPDSRAGRLWSRLSPYLAYTTEGDTAAIFKNSYVWNVLDPRARAVSVEELTFYVRDNSLDWVMLDFFTVPMPNLKDAKWEAHELGDLDLNQNGIGHWDDPAEQQALRAAFDAYINELRSMLPPDFKLIPNGALAMTDPSFSRLVDGCYVEGFPAWFYGGGDVGNYVNALSAHYGPQALPNLTNPRRWASGPTIMIENRWDDNKIGYLCLLYDGLVEMKRPIEPAVDTNQPVDLSFLGVPREPTTFDGRTATRTFSGGVLTIDVTPTVITPYVQGGK